MKVLLLMPCRFLGGPEVQTIQAIVGLKERHGVDFVVAVFPAGNVATGDNPMVARARAAGFEAFEFTHAMSYDLVGAHLKVRSLVRRHKPDVICSMGYKADLVASAFRRTPTLAVVHGWTGASRGVRLFESADRKVLRHLSAVGYVSPTQKQLLRDIGVPERKLFWLTNAIDLARLPPPVNRTALRTSLGVGPGTPLVGSVGRLSFEKAQRFLVEAFATVVKAKPDAHLVLVGDGPEEARLREQVRTLGLEARTHFLGLRPDGAQLVGALDVVALPSLTEAMPVVALEACAYKTPMVSSRVGAMPQILANGDAGWLVAPGDVATLASSILEALADGGRRAARSHAGLIEHFTIERQLEAWKLALDFCRRIP